MTVDLSGYNDVAARIAELREKYPDGRLRPADPAVPYRIEEIAGQTFVVYVAACYRNELDKLPGIGMAWEPFPGKSNFTRDSELQNAETSAWGRAIVATLAADTKAAPIASREEVANRRSDQDGPRANGGVSTPTEATAPQKAKIKYLLDQIDGPTVWMLENDLHPIPETLARRQASQLIDHLETQPKSAPAQRVSTLRSGEEPF